IDSVSARRLAQSAGLVVDNRIHLTIRLPPVMRASATAHKADNGQHEDKQAIIRYHAAASRDALSACAISCNTLLPIADDCHSRRRRSPRASHATINPRARSFSTQALTCGGDKAN